MFSKNVYLIEQISFYHQVDLFYEELNEIVKNLNIKKPLKIKKINEDLKLKT